MAGKIELVEHQVELKDFPLEPCLEMVAAATGDPVEYVRWTEQWSSEKCRQFAKQLMEWKIWEPIRDVELTFEMVTNRTVATKIHFYAQSCLRTDVVDEFLHPDKCLKVIMPAAIKGTLEEALWREQIEEAYDVYLYLLEHGHKPDDACSVLPLETKALGISATMRLTGFRDFLKSYTGKDAWPEVRLLARKMAQTFVKLLPNDAFLIEDVWHKEVE